MTYDSTLAKFPNEWKALEQEEDALVEDILSAGKLGDKDMNQIQSDNITLNAVKNEKRGSARKKTVLHIIFLPLKEMRKTRKYLEKHPYLLPVA